MSQNRLKTLAVSLVAVAALTGVTTACEPPAAAPATGGTSDSKAEDTRPSKSVAEEFKAYVAANGTANEKAAVKHVTKIVGGDENNNVLDTAEVHTDYTGGMISDDANNGKLLATSFAEFQASRNLKSENGLVTIYNAKGELLSNGKF